MAPVIIAVFLDKHSSYDREKDIMAIGACIHNMLLEIHSQGIGPCWVGEILRNKHLVDKLRKVDDRYEICTVIALDYSSEKTKRSVQKNQLVI